MPLGLLKYGRGSDYPFERQPDLPGPRELKSISVNGDPVDITAFQNGQIARFSLPM